MSQLQTTVISKNYDIGQMIDINHSGELLNRFPNFELSYETISHKKVSPSIHNIAMAIPHGKKYYAWFSYDIPDDDVIYMMELNKEKRITKIQKFQCPNNVKLSLGTILYGVLLTESNIFIIEDIHQYKGFPMKNMFLNEKLPLLCELIEETSNYPIKFRLPAIWPYKGDHDESILPEKYKNLPYQVHHIQYRSLCNIAPLLNFPIKISGINNSSQTNISVSHIIKPRGILDTVSLMTTRPCYTKPQYQLSTIFHVCADIQYDIYHLFAYGKSKTLVYYDLAYIPNYKTSVFMNSLFRNIRENQNLDSIEESDDEDDFQNIAEDKYVDLFKLLLMECRFHPKFRRWIPQRVIQPPCKVVHISQL